MRLFLKHGHRYQSSDEVIACNQPDCQHIPANEDCEIHKYKCRICHAVRSVPEHIANIGDVLV